MAPPHVAGLRIVDMYSSRGRLMMFSQSVFRLDWVVSADMNTDPRIASLYVSMSLRIPFATTRREIEFGMCDEHGNSAHFFGCFELSSCLARIQALQKRIDMNYHRGRSLGRQSIHINEY